GLLLPVSLYRSVGGFNDMPLMEDVDFVRRLGSRRLTFLRSEAVTSAERYRTGGYVLRSLRNVLCFSLYLLRVPPGVIARLY
ncbi:hypothetical protein AAEJ42_23290, partial [Shewanella algae]|uniref:hypothetical protein n=1 Tax=Shewanella algae TaxID=38313 RepID=UPI00313E61A1